MYAVINDISDTFYQKLFVPQYPSSSMTLDSKLEMNPSKADTQGISCRALRAQSRGSVDSCSASSAKSLHLILHKHSTTANPEPRRSQERIRTIKPWNYWIWWLQAVADHFQKCHFPNNDQQAKIKALELTSILSFIFKFRSLKAVGKTVGTGVNFQSCSAREGNWGRIISVQPLLHRSILIYSLFH